MNTQKSLLPCTNESQEKDGFPASGFDHLSNLHESLLSHILFMLPTKDGIPKSWKYKWRCMRRINIKDIVRTRCYSSSNESFGNFVERILSLVHNLTNVSIRYEGIDSKRVIAWIYDLFGRHNIESLELSSLFCFIDTDIVLPWNLLDKFSLKNLELRLPGCTLIIDTMDSFAKLKRFHLYGIQIKNGNSRSDTLILNFPVLERLELMRCRFENVIFVKIYAPVLSTFISKTTSLEEPNDYHVEIIGSMVSTFESLGGLPENVVFTGSQVASASFWNEYHQLDNLRDLSLLKAIGSQSGKLLNESSKLNELTLSNVLVQAFHSVPPLCRHDELKRLILWEPIDPNLLCELLHVAPSLQFLSVNVYGWKHFDKKLLPSCLISQLEEVELHGFSGKKPQYDLVKCVLKNSRVLKKVSMNGLVPYEQQHKVLKRLSQFPNVSSRLTFVFQRPPQGPITLTVDTMEQIQKPEQ